MKLTTPVTLVLVLTSSACGSSAPALRPIDKGDDIERFIALQENYATLIERAKTPADAGRSLEAYCGEHRATIDAVSLATQRLTASEDSPHREKLIASTERMMSRMQKAGGRDGWADGSAVSEALDKCIAPPAGAAGGTTGDGESLGVPVCDLYLARYTQCIAALPEEAQAAGREALAAMQGGWQALKGTDPEVLAQACQQALDIAKENMGSVCPDVVWE